MIDAASTADTGPLHGRNRIASRAIRSVVSAVAAGELGSTAKSIDVDIADDGGALAVTVSAPVGIPSLAAVAASRAAPAETSTILERANAARATIRERVHTLTGSSISVVNLRLTTARIEGDGRVR